MQSLNKCNTVTLCGQVVNKPVLGHIINGEKFYCFYLNVKRQSQKFDILYIIVPYVLIENININEDDYIKIEGQFRSYNNKKSEGKKLELFVFSKKITKLEEEAYENIAEFIGFVCKDVIFRTTPKGKKITDILLALNRGYSKSDYIPAIAWGKNAYVASNFCVGDKIKITGRIQSRTYNKVIENKKNVMIAYEMSINQIEKAD